MLVSACVLLVTAGQTPAVDPPVLDRETHEQHTDNGVSARLLVGRAVVADEHVPLAGVGVAYERDFMHSLVAIEAAVEWLAEPDGSALFVELIVEKPIPVTDRSTLYVGGGPAFVEHLPAHHAATPGVGALMLVGLETVVVDHWEVFVELDTAFVYADHPVVETDVGAGVMWRF